MKILAVIPARGGSKGIPKKNIIDLNGNPMISYMIKAAKASKYIDKLVVSTDCPDIAEVSRKYGADIVNRPAEYATDKASSDCVINHALEVEGGYDMVILLQCTSPLTTTEDIDGCIKHMIDTGANSCITGCRFDHFLWQPPNENTKIWKGVGHREDLPRLRRQDKPLMLLENGAVYCMDVKSFLKTQHRFIHPLEVFVTPQSHCFEIDEPHELAMCEFLMQKS